MCVIFQAVNGKSGEPDNLECPPPEQQSGAGGDDLPPGGDDDIVDVEQEIQKIARSLVDDIVTQVSGEQLDKEK